MIGETHCTGIGAPEAAAPWIDWRLGGEIDPFPIEVMAHRRGYRDARKGRDATRRPLMWGDFTALRPRHYRRLGLPYPDVIVAGTPCQAFSIAGRREGLADPRGNLTLSFVRHIHAIANAARHHGRRPPGVVWENVPGVLSGADNAFGCFLGALVGGDDALHTPDGKSWPSVGMVAGPRARVAWRILDAQHFGLAQRRKRLFAVIDLGGRADPAKVLFEPRGVRGDSAPGREAGQDAASDAPDGAGIGGGIVANCGDRSYALNTRGGRRLDAESDTLIAFNSRENPCSGAIAGALGTSSPQAQAVAVAVAFDTTQITSPGNFSVPKSGASCHPLAAGAHPPAVAFNLRGRDGGAMPEIAEAASLRAASGGSSNSYVAVTGSVTHALNTANNGKGCSEDGTGRGVPTIGGHEAGDWAVRRLTPRECERLQGFPDDFTLIPWRGGEAPDGRRYKALGNSMAVPVLGWILRRLTDEMEADHG